MAIYLPLLLYFNGNFICNEVSIKKIFEVDAAINEYVYLFPSEPSGSERVLECRDDQIGEGSPPPRGGNVVVSW